MTPADLAVLGELAYTSTPGPWKAYPDKAPLYVLGYDGRTLTMSLPDRSSVFINSADAAFIAAARAAIPDLIAALEEAEAKVLKADGMANEINILTREVKAAEARAAELQAEAALWQRRCAELDTKASDERARSAAAQPDPAALEVTERDRWAWRLGVRQGLETCLKEAQTRSPDVLVDVMREMLKNLDATLASEGR